MRIKYVGPKPEISYSSVSFNKSKEDKFVYINSAYQLLQSLEHDYKKNRSYVDTINTPCMREDELEKMIASVCIDVDTCIKYRQDELLCLFEKEIQQVRNCQCMDAVSKRIFFNNHALMKEYRLQRQINKSIYYMLIQKITYAIKENKIKYIVTPIHEKFIYILMNLQNALMQDKAPIFTKLEVYQDKNELKIRLCLSTI